MNPRRKIEINWSKDIAYIVGLLVTDGNLSSDGRHINFTSKDIQLIKTFRKCLGIKNKIGLKMSGFSDRKYFRIQFSDVVLYRWFLKIGLTPAKTHTIGKLEVPDEYFSDFLRGHFDGDGSCYSYWDKRWRSSFMFYTHFVSASEKHVIWLRQKIDELLKVKGHIDTVKRNGVYQLRYAKKDSRILVSNMYYQENLPHLKRKYKKLAKIINIDNKENKRKR
mgnify:CR=1 FL=1